MPQGYNPSFRVMPLGHKLGRKTIMTRLMPLGHNPSTRLMPLRHKVSVYGNRERDTYKCQIYNIHIKLTE